MRPGLAAARRGRAPRRDRRGPRRAGAWPAATSGSTGSCCTACPAIGDLPPDELAALNAAHADWLYRLAVVGVLLPEATRPRVHRLIVGGGQRSVDAVDGIELQINGTWPDPDAASAALGIVRRTGATTPLTGYDIDMDGPFGDADPSVYL